MLKETDVAYFKVLVPEFPCMNSRKIRPTWIRIKFQPGLWAEIWNRIFNHQIAALQHVCPYA